MAGQIRDSNLQRIFREKEKWHRSRARLPVEEKLLILIKLQKLAAEVAAVRGLSPGPVWPVEKSETIAPGCPSA